MSHRATREEYTIRNGNLDFEYDTQCRVGDDIFYQMLDDKYVSKIRVLSLSSEWDLNVYLDNGAKIVEKIDTIFTMYKEHRGNKDHWYAYRRCMGKLAKRYVGATEDVTEVRLWEIARKLPTCGK